MPPSAPWMNIFGSGPLSGRSGGLGRCPIRTPVHRRWRPSGRSTRKGSCSISILQWQVEEQLEEVQQTVRDRGAEIGLYLDLALGIDPGGADAWAYRDFLVSGVKAGAPPDDFAPQGQDWGFQPSNREKHRDQGYRLLAGEIRKNCRPGGALRIDHVMKLFRLFWIAEGQPASQGGYVRDFFEDLVKILCLESVRNKTLIIGEDLGTVPDTVREVLGRHGIFSYRLFYFEKDESGQFRDPGEYPARGPGRGQHP